MEGGADGGGGGSLDVFDLGQRWLAGLMLLMPSSSCAQMTLRSGVLECSQSRVSAEARGQNEVN